MSTPSDSNARPLAILAMLALGVLVLLFILGLVSVFLITTYLSPPAVVGTGNSPAVNPVASAAAVTASPPTETAPPVASTSSATTETATSPPASSQATVATTNIASATATSTPGVTQSAAPVATAMATVAAPSQVPTPSPPLPAGALLVPGRIEAEDYRPGGEGAGYHDLTKGNLGRAYRNDDVDIEGCPGQAQCYNVAWVKAGEWLGYDVRFPADGTYDFTVRAAAAAPGRRLHLELDGVDITGPLSVPATGGWHSWTDVVKADVPVKTGDYVMRLVVDTDGVNVDGIIVSGDQAMPPPAATQASTP